MSYFVGLVEEMGFNRGGKKPMVFKIRNLVFLVFWFVMVFLCFFGFLGLSLESQK